MTRDTSWSDRADRVLQTLFVPGEPAASRAAVYAAYPFGPRSHWPYKVWCRRVRAWAAAHARGMSRPAEAHRNRTPPERYDRETLELEL